jgi:hypothetical protein
MLFGHNTNVTVNGMVIHVQTEDRGTNSALIDTTVYHRGRVLHRRTNSYSDLLPLDRDRESALKIRLDDQHRTVVEELRSGALQIALPVAPPASASVATRPLAAPPAKGEPARAIPAEQIVVDLMNPRTWLTGKHASLYLIVRSKEGATPVAAARVASRIEGGAEAAQASAVTGIDGHAQLQFEMPRLVSEEAILIIEAVSGESRGQLRFQLRAKPRVPAAG